MNGRRFDIEEANALIPRLEIIMEKLQRGALRLREEIREVATAEQVPAGEVSTARLLELRPALRGLLADLDGLVEEIEAHGCHFKDLEIGLVDFPAEVDGEPAELCWQYGEKEVAFWHHVGDGFARRRRLPAAVRPRQSYLQ